MKFFTKTLTILIEIAGLGLSILWYVRTKEIEPLIGIISLGGALLISVISKFTIRPRIILHYKNFMWGRSPRGYTNNNPPVIRVGIDHPEQFWELNWKYDLEIRNNSSLTAYNIEIKYINLPLNTSIEGEIGKIEPVQPHEIRTFRIKLIQNVTGTHIDAERYLKENARILTKDFTIMVKYTDEGGVKFITKYLWATDENQLKIF